jgi:hypothetical protein
LVGAAVGNAQLVQGAPDNWETEPDSREIRYDGLEANESKVYSAEVQDGAIERRNSLKILWLGVLHLNVARMLSAGAGLQTPRTISVNGSELGGHKGDDDPFDLDV